MGLETNNEVSLHYACVTCATPVESSGMCERCSRAYGIGAREERCEILTYLESERDKEPRRVFLRESGSTLSSAARSALEEVIIHIRGRGPLIASPSVGEDPQCPKTSPIGVPCILRDHHDDRHSWEPPQRSSEPLPGVDEHIQLLQDLRDDILGRSHIGRTVPLPTQLREASLCARVDKAIDALRDGMKHTNEAPCKVVEVSSRVCPLKHTRSCEEPTHWQRSNEAPPHADHELEKLAALAAEMSDMLPVRLYADRQRDTTVLRDANGVAVADLLSSGAKRGQYQAFDRYLRDAMNIVPSLLEELRRAQRTDKAPAVLVEYQADLLKTALRALLKVCEEVPVKGTFGELTPFFGARAAAEEALAKCSETAKVEGEKR